MRRYVVLLLMMVAGGCTRSIAPMGAGSASASADPHSPEAARHVAQSYAALLEQHDFPGAYRLLNNDGPTQRADEAAFTASFAAYRSIHAEVGKPFDEEGAAVSIYIKLPLHLYGTTRNGAAFNRVGNLTLRRVDGVDGATPAQLRWHIAQIDLTP